MKKSLSFGVFLFLFTFNIGLQAQNTGEELYKATCAACHTINKGRLVGPDLKGISEVRDQDWLIRFIRSSQQMIKNGDSLSIALFKEYNQIPMPDHNLNNEEILRIISYINETSPEDNTLPEQISQIKDSNIVAFSNEILKKGSALFYGYESFSNGHFKCMSCHSIHDESTLGGGKLSLDLTKSYSKLGQAGIKAILTSPPFPVMSKALHKKLTEDEIGALTDMLHYVDQQHRNNQPKENSGLFFIVFGFILSMFMLIHIYLAYDNRKIS